MTNTIQWDAVPDADVAGYVVYHGYAPGNYFEWFTVTAPATSLVLNNVHDWRRHYYAVSAFDEVPNESAKSVEVSIQGSHIFKLR